MRQSKTLIYKNLSARAEISITIRILRKDHASDFRINAGAGIQITNSVVYGGGNGQRYSIDAYSIDISPITRGGWCVVIVLFEIG